MRVILATVANFAAMCLKSAPVTCLCGSAWEQQPSGHGQLELGEERSIFHHPSQILQEAPGLFPGTCLLFLTS